MSKSFFVVMFLLINTTVQANQKSCYNQILKEEVPTPKVLNILLIDTTTTILKNVQEGYEEVVDKIARHYGNRIIVVPFSSLTSQQPPVASFDVNNEPPLSEEVIQNTAIKPGKLMQVCVLKNAQRNAIAVKNLVHKELQKNSTFDSYSEIFFAIKSMLAAYEPSAENSRIRLIVYSDGYINSLKGFSLYAKGKPRIPNPQKDVSSISKIEKIVPISKEFEVIWFGLGLTPMSSNKGYIAPSDLEKLKDFWSGVLEKMGASRIQIGLVVNNPDLS